VRRRRCDFEPIITEDLFQRAQALLSGRIPNAALRLQAHPDFPLRNVVRCARATAGLQEAGRRAGATTTRTTTAGPAAAA
jgi:hypothetical protein